MSECRDLKFIPDCPGIRQLVTKDLGKIENEVQAMKEGGDSLDQIELTMAVEEVLHRLQM